MNKAQFIWLLNSQLTPLREEERRELMADYEAHFAFGLQNGKTEEEIVNELGDPVELAKEILGDRYEGPQTHRQTFQTYQPSSDRSNAGKGRSVIKVIALVFLNLLAVPIGLAGWCVWFSLALAGGALICAPLLFAVDTALTQAFDASKMYASILLAGLGILLALGAAKLFRIVKKTTAAYIRWNANVSKGRA